jgi:hypothetical protein
VARIEQENEKLNRVLAKLHTDLTDTLHLPYVMMKGQGTGALYPNPLHRCCGDIDVYVGKEGLKVFHAAYKELQYQCYKIGRDNNVYIDEGVHIECHYRMAHFYSPLYALRLAQILKVWFPSKCVLRTIACKTNILVPVPPAWYEAVFSVIHFSHHLRVEGIGLRHLCDWYVLTHNQTFDEDKYRKYLSVFGEVHTERAMMELAEYILRATDKLSSKDARIIEEEMLYGGNFGKYHTDGAEYIIFDSQGGFLSVFWKGMKHDIKRSVRLYRFNEMESVLAPFCRIAGYVQRRIKKIGLRRRGRG